MRNCPNCGTGIPDSDEVCPQCNLRVAKAAPPATRGSTLTPLGCLAIAAVGVAVIVVASLLSERDNAPSSARRTTARPCLAVSAELVRAITNGLTVYGGGRLEHTWAVRSGAHKKGFFVSAEIHGAGMEGQQVIGTWLTNDITGAGGLIYSVDAMAREFSDWGVDIKRQLATMSDPGARESQDCVRRRGQ